MSTAPDVLIIGDYYHVPRQRLMETYSCVVYEDAADPAALLAEIAPTCRAIASHARVDDALMAALPNLGVIANFGLDLIWSMSQRPPSAASASPIPPMC
jgi:hypothetical protein